MIIATALGTLFNGQTVNVIDQGTPIANKSVNFHYGDQKELLLWIKLRGNKGKYPLIWYVLNNYTEHEGWYETDAKIVVMQLTKGDPLNTWRQSNSYLGIIDPVTELVKEKLKNQFVQIVSQDLETRFTFKDEPNYGVDTSESDFNSTKENGTKSIVTDIVDARTIRFRLRIKAKCIIN
jgi:hypothetical protein